MNILIIHAHENPDSFSTALANKAKSVGERLGHEVIISDLYAQGFNPVGAKHDFKGDSGTAYYKYAMEQLHASKTNGFSDEVQLEIDKLLKADFLIFNFPLWWYDMPAILKGWVDRVMAYGVAYGGDYGFGPDGRFKGRRAMATITTGTPVDQYQKPIEDILDNIHSGIFRLVGFEVVGPFVASAVSRITHLERMKILKEYKEILTAVLDRDNS